MAVRTIDSRPAGAGDLAVGLWIAEGARSLGEHVLIVEEGRADIVRAFGHETTPAPSDECMGLGVHQNTFNDEFTTADVDRTPRTLRWQRTMGWNFAPRRPSLLPLPPDAVGWARGLAGDRPFVVVAPRANVGSRSLPMQKWLRVVRSLEDRGLRTIARD